jgi:hypothetical protein
MFNYTEHGSAGDANGAGGGSGLISTARLRQKVRQEPLPLDVMTAIHTDLGPGGMAAARGVLELLETVISFLTATGGSYVQRLDVGDKLLMDYVRNVLLLEAEGATHSSTLAREVRLKHVDALYQGLRAFCVVDLFACVRPKYKWLLEETTAERLRMVAGYMKLPLLMPVFKDFILAQVSVFGCGTGGDGGAGVVVVVVVVVVTAVVVVCSS